MKNIKDITVEVRYKVGLGDYEVSDAVYKGLCKIQDKGSMSNSELTNCNETVSKAFEWLSDHISENDAYEWEYEIIDLID
jgi:hypothetical protein